MIDLQLETQLNQDKTGTATIIMARAKSCKGEIMKQANHPEKDLGAVVWAILDWSQAADLQTMDIALRQGRTAGSQSRARDGATTL